MPGRCGSGRGDMVRSFEPEPVAERMPACCPAANHIGGRRPWTICEVDAPARS